MFICCSILKSNEKKIVENMWLFVSYSTQVKIHIEF